MGTKPDNGWQDDDEGWPTGKRLAVTLLIALAAGGAMLAFAWDWVFPHP